LRTLAAHRIACVERCTRSFAERSISLIPVCLDPAKLSLKCGLAKVNIVHLHSGHGGGPWPPQGSGYTRREKEDDCRPRGGQRVFRHRFMGYVLSVTGFLTGFLVTGFLSLAFFVTGFLMGDAEGPLPFMDSIKQHKVHVFTREFADIVLKELDTIADFTAYLAAKEAIAEKEITILGGEENLLGKYLHAGRTFDWMQNYDSVFINDSIWPTIQKKPEFIAKKELGKISYGWDSMIERANEGSNKYERLARELARPDRFTRRILSQAFFEAYGEFVSSDHEMLRRYMPLGGTSYCFLITNDDEYPSKRRETMLGLMCEVARGLPPMNKRVIGVATGRVNPVTAYLLQQIHAVIFVPADRARVNRCRVAALPTRRITDSERLLIEVGVNIKP
jgi:hypothetical protein